MDLATTAKEVLEQWNQNNTFQKSLTTREGHPTFVFYEGPPSANGTPGIHHVMARTIKDIFCRYKTQQGFLVERKAGWDTHGLPVELGVEKKLGITKDEIGRSITVEQYNAECRADVMTYTDMWNRLTQQMGYWVDMEHPYITYDNKYIETLWYLLKELHTKGLLYKGYTIQPYSPAAGTGLSNHELNQPGCYRDVKDTTCVAEFRVVRDAASEGLFAASDDASLGELFILAWTTTPWTLPSNTALAVGSGIDYVQVASSNPYTGAPQRMILARDLVEKVFSKSEYTVIGEYKGADLQGVRYEQLIPWIRPEASIGDSFRVIVGDFVTTEDGTGIVHIAPTFGADDDRAGKQNGIAPLLLRDTAGKMQPMVDRAGKFFVLDELDSEYVAAQIDTESYAPYAGKFVKNAYDPAKGENDETLDVEICMMLKSMGQVFRIEKHTHNYPHCWRTDKPVLYYPLDSWFIRTTAVKDRLIELNNTINWKPASTGSGRFGKWLENLVDWNLSRSRYWGTPLPIWVTEDKEHLKCIGSVEELKAEIELSVKAGHMSSNPLAEFTPGDYSTENYTPFDLHRPWVDSIILTAPNGAPMVRESDLIDVWFDSGAMPYAQVHYPFEITPEQFEKVYPADFIAEGVDQTRGWFFTLHALSTMLHDSVAFRNIISNGLVLDKNGNKMSKRLGNGVDPFEVMDRFGADAVRWYMVSNSQPWDNLRFDVDGVDEVRRKFFGTLYNTYSFFALYANVDSFTGSEPQVPMAERAEIDRWIISLLNTLVSEVSASLEGYDPTPAARAIADFVGENLSNWYVRLNRRRFWGGEMSQDKLAAYQTLYTCLDTVVRLAAPFAPFITDRIFCDLNRMSGLSSEESVHLAPFPVADPSMVNKELEERMSLAQRTCSMVLALRRRVNIKVRQPLQKMIIPVLDAELQKRLEAVEALILSEVNVKEMEYIHDTTGVITKRIKPNFKTLGPKYSKLMKQISAQVAAFTQADIATLEANAGWTMNIDGAELPMELADFEITSEDMPGWLVASEGRLTVALEVTLTDELREEGIARELVNRIQNLRKDSGFEVTDRIAITLQHDPTIEATIARWGDYIASQTLATGVSLSRETCQHPLEIDDMQLSITITKL